MGTDLIAEYLEALHVRLRARRDVEDLVAEAADHLRDHAERLVAGGCDPGDAARRAIEAFGEPAVVARAHLTAPSGQLAIPTVNTRSAGSLASVAAVLWVAVLAMWSATHVVNSRDLPLPGDAFFYVGVLALLGASALTFSVAMAIRERHGRSLGSLGIAGLVAIAAGAASTTLLGWAVPFWMTLLAVGTALLAVAMLRRPIAPRLPTVLFAIALPAGMAAFVAAQVLGIGNPDEFGDHPVATLGALGVGCSLIAAAMWSIGAWLRAEEPYADFDAANAIPRDA